MVKLFKITATCACFMALVIFALNVTQTKTIQDAQASEHPDSKYMLTESSQLIVKRYYLDVPKTDMYNATWEKVKSVMDVFTPDSPPNVENKTWFKISESRNLITVNTTHKFHTEIKKYLDKLQKTIASQIDVDIKIVGIAGNKNKIQQYVKNNISNQYKNIAMNGFYNSFKINLSPNQSAESIISNLEQAGKLEVISFNFKGKQDHPNKQSIKTLPGIKNATFSTRPYIKNKTSQFDLKLNLSKNIFEQTIVSKNNSTFIIGGFANKSNIKNLRKISKFSNLIKYNKDMMFLIFITSKA